MKDRVALEIVQEALAEGRLAPGGLVTEGTVGSTGVSLAMCAAAYGCRVFIAMPDDAAIEKAQMLQVSGGGCGLAGRMLFVNLHRRCRVTCRMLAYCCAWNRGRCSHRPHHCRSCPLLFGLRAGAGRGSAAVSSRVHHPSRPLCECG